MPSSSALAVAPSFIFTKKGLMSVFVIMHALVSCARAGEDASKTPAANRAKTVDFMSSSLVTVSHPRSGDAPRSRCRNGHGPAGGPECAGIRKQHGFGAINIYINFTYLLTVGPAPAHSP